MYWKLLRFDPTKISSFKGFLHLLHEPRDPSLLAYLRIAFGLLMMLDIPQERGMPSADRRFTNDPNICRFPLFSFLHPLDTDSMILIYSLMFIGAVGICLGFFYRISCLIFSLSYWFIFLLEKTAWNNHSYLYGIIAIFFLFVDAHRYASIDGLLNRRIRNSEIPLWMISLIRFQIFIVYFIAGIKKTDSDWLQGHSMTNLARHWVFAPFKIFFDEEILNLFLVHKFGFLLDLTVGFLLFWNSTRMVGFLFCASFNLMNSQIFSIGMFPYTMLATMFCFCSCSSFKNFIGKIPGLNRIIDTSMPQKNINCSDMKKPLSKFVPSWKQLFCGFLVIYWISIQLFLPFSHFITKGYNGWTEGPYGYSWDMMVQNTATQHIRISYKSGNKTGFIKPSVISNIFQIYFK